MYFRTVKCKLDGDRIVIEGSKYFLSFNSKLKGNYFALVRQNYLGSIDLYRILPITSENTIEDEIGVI